MPGKPPKACRVNGCHNLVYGDESYCEQHRRQYQADDRPSAAKRGYGYNWKKLRLMVLREQPFCSDPFSIHDYPVLATEVDHIIPIADGGDYSMDNLQPLCKSCHSRKTRLWVGGHKSLKISEKRPCGQSKNLAREMRDSG